MLSSRLSVALGIAVVALEGRAEDAAFFESRIRPVLVEQCYECHSVESGKAKGGLQVDNRASLRRGGESGPAVVPGKPAESLLLSAMLHADPDLAMPPKKPRLAEGVLADFRRWIERGAVDPREESAISGSDAGGDGVRWSYRALPERVAAGASVESLWLAGLERQGLSPGLEADARTLLRRVYLDLTGLPPSPEEVAAFKLDQLPQVVDRLLASPEFGVRWGRHWLDVVRFAESNGRESNIIYPHAWRYRDYVIEAFQRDLPYDQFLREQIAGDLLPSASAEERARRLIATGFLALGAKGLNEQNKAQFAADLADEQLDTLSRAVLATSIACARCHDHKADPVAMTDYYALIGIFKSTQTHYGTWVDSENNNGGSLIPLPDLPGQLRPGRAVPPARVAEMKAQLAELKAQAEKGQAMRATMQTGKLSREDFNDALREALRIYWTQGSLEGALSRVDDEGQPLALCMGVTEAAVPVNSPVYGRGDLKNPGPEQPRGVPALFGLPAAPAVAAEASGRLMLAQWLTDPRHPLTARVMANRIWTHLFGAGLVRTVDDFGGTGEPPSHPELLDLLARRLIDGGWSVKALIRELVLARPYRQSSTFREAAFVKDPDNRLLWRMPPRRVDAEVLRDSMLAISGELDRTPRPGSLAAEVGTHSVAILGFQKDVPTDLDGSLHRSVYLPVFRENLPDVLALFDFAEPSLVVGQRDETNVPPQALYLMNSPFVTARAQALAERLLQQAPQREAQITQAFQLCFQRDPDAAERELARDFLATASGSPTAALAQFCQSLFAAPEFRITY